MDTGLLNKENPAIMVNTDTVACLLLVVFYSLPFFKWCAEKAMELVGMESLGIYALIAVLYTIVFVLCALNRKQEVLEFLVLLSIIVAFFIITILVHPEYEYVYTRERYGVLPYVLRPDNGIYAFLFIRLVGKPDKILESLHISSYLMLAFSFTSLLMALSRGYWVGENHLGELQHYSYDLNFGFNLLIPVCVFIFFGLQKRSVKELLLAAFGIVMIFIGGSRGPILDIFIFCALYFVMTTLNSRNGVRNIVIAVIFGAIMIVFLHQILSALVSILGAFHINSRTITKLLEGSISEDNGRNLIWMTAIEHLKAHPFGSGAMGARNAIYHVHYVGHPHNLFLELLIDYGIILGPIIIAVMVGGSIYILFSKRTYNWRWVYLIFFAQACSLLTSYTYWHSTGIWGALAVAVCALQMRLDTTDQCKSI